MSDSVDNCSITGYAQASFWLIVFFLFGFVGWAAFAPLNSAAVASGKISVEGQTKKVQHLEGGIIQSILVENGDVVKKDQIVAVLNGVQILSELEIVDGQYYELLAKYSRLVAERDGADAISFDSELEGISDAWSSQLRGTQSQLWEQRVKGVESQIYILETKTERLKEQVTGTESLHDSKGQYLQSIDAEIEELQELYAQKLTNKVRMRDAKRKRFELDGDLAGLKTEIANLQVEISEAQEQIVLTRREYMQQVLSELDEVENRLLDVRSRKQALEDRVARINIRSPVDGVVENLQIFTQGAVLGSGETLMSIVPAGKESIIEARLELTDIDKVRTGLMADVRFSAYSSQSVHVVEAVVSYVSSDRLVNNDSGDAYYTVKLSFTENGREQAVKNGFETKTGMPVEVMIKTGRRTLMSYLVQPFTNMISRALNED